MRIIIYGLGKYTEKIVSLLRKEHIVVAYTDTFSSIQTYGGRPFIECKKLSDVEFDYLIITIVNRKLALKIAEELAQKYAIPDEKIIPFFVNYYKTEIDSKLYQMKHFKFDGIILGNSHARYGIDETILPHSFMNLALSSQDLYCNKRVCEMIVCKNLFSTLKFAIVDLFDYNFLNIDNSRGGGFYEYIDLGGIIDIHNYEKNKCFSESFPNGLLEHISLDIDAYENQANDLFEKIELLYGEFYRELYAGERRRKIFNYYLDEKNILTSNLYERNEDTILENKENLKEIVKNLKKINPDIKIIFTMLPRFEVMERVMSRLMPAFWKEELEKELLKICKKYGAVYKNYKNCKEIYENKNFYMDASHLNNGGAKAVTYKLIDDLQMLW